MRMVDLIQTKRDGNVLTNEHISWFVSELVAGHVPDYQTAALLMAIFLRGMDRDETVALTLAMAKSGDTLDLHDVAPVVVDKHSSGGVGDKTTLVVLPLVAAAGLPVGKMSGRGLGSSGGTLDKMESFPNWSSKLTLLQFKRQLADIGAVLAGQTAVLAPADGMLYALRDVTATVDNKSLIAASIMSKKLAAGADAIVLDVKIGSGAFMPTPEAARELSEMMVAIGSNAGRRTVALLSDMNQPLGHAVGNALEVREAIATLRGTGPADFWAHCLEVAAAMLLVAGTVETVEAGREKITAVRDSGAGLAKFRAVVAAQGGDPTFVDDPTKLKLAEFQTTLTAPQSGWLASVETGEIGWAVVHLGGGRLVKTDKVDHSVGLNFTVKVGDKVAAGDPIGKLYASSEAKLAKAKAAVLGALHWSETAVDPLPQFYGTVG